VLDVILIRQGGTHSLEQRFLAERFAQKSRRTSLQRLDMNIVTIICSDENDRNSVIPSSQPAL
jgi:hypothetical protein